MIKAGLIGAVIGFVYIASLSLLSPFCTVFFTPFLGLGVGYLVGFFETPTTLETSLTRSTITGGITGLIVLLGQMLTAVINGVLITNWGQGLEAMQELDIATPLYWQVTVGINLLCGIFNVAIIMLLATLGGYMWFQRSQPTMEDIA